MVRVPSASALQMCHSIEALSRGHLRNSQETFSHPMHQVVERLPIPRQLIAKCGTFEELYVQRTFEEHSGHVPGTFEEHSGNI